MSTTPMGMNRREALQLAAATGGLSLLTRGPLPAQDADVEPATADDGNTHSISVVDTNVSLSRWPFRRLPLDAPEALVGKLRALGITQAWAGSFDALLHRDLTSVNRRVADVCQRYPELLPVGSINPRLPGWQDDLQRCHHDYNTPGIRLYPGCHEYGLADQRFRRLLERATEAKQFVQLVVSLEDPRTQHARLRTPDVELSPLPDVLADVPAARLQLLNWRPRGELLETLAATTGVVFDTARVESTDGVPELAERVSLERVVFGSHSPFLIPEAALIRVHESGRFSDAALRAVLAGNARQFQGVADA